LHLAPSSVATRQDAPNSQAGGSGSAGQQGRALPGVVARDALDAAAREGGQGVTIAQPADLRARPLRGGGGFVIR
jgi:hypothetical protein